MCCRGRSTVEDVVDIDLKIIDLKYLLEMFDDDRVFVEHIISDGLKSFKKLSETLRSLKSDDFDKISKIAHNLKGSSANLACAPLSSASSDLEEYMKAPTKKKKLVEEKIKLVLKEIKNLEDFTKSNVYTNTLDREK